MAKSDIDNYIAERDAKSPGFKAKVDAATERAEAHAATTDEVNHLRAVANAAREYIRYCSGSDVERPLREALRRLDEAQATTITATCDGTCSRYSVHTQLSCGAPCSLAANHDDGCRCRHCAL